jgi:hypothetical protein
MMRRLTAPEPCRRRTVTVSPILTSFSVFIFILLNHDAVDDCFVQGDAAVLNLDDQVAGHLSDNRHAGVDNKAQFSQVATHLILTGYLADQMHFTWSCPCQYHWNLLLV